MKTLLRTIGFAMLLLGAAPIVAGDDDSESAVVGRWESGGSDSGLGSALDVYVEGRLVIAIVLLGEITYRVEDDRLILALSNTAPRGRRETILQFTIDGDTMTLRGPEGRGAVQKKRVGAPVPGAAPIVGVWTHRRGTGQVVYERYTADGRCELRLPLGSREVRYRLPGTDEESAEAVATLRLEGDVLLYEEAGGGEVVRYHRVASPAWYPLPAPQDPAAERSRRRMLTRVFGGLDRDGGFSLRYGPSPRELEPLGESEGRLGGSPEERRLALEGAATALTALMRQRPELREEDGCSRLLLVLRAPWDTPWSHVADLLTHLRDPPTRIYRVELIPDGIVYAPLYMKLPKQRSESGPQQWVDNLPMIVLRRVEAAPSDTEPSRISIRVGGSWTYDLPAGWTGFDPPDPLPGQEHLKALAARTLEAFSAAMRRQWAMMEDTPGVVVRFVPTDVGQPGWRYAEVRHLISAANRAGLEAFDFGGAMPGLQGALPPDPD